METVFTIVHVVVALFMIVVVLLQAGKGSGMGALGGGASQTAFGASSGMTFLGKLTTVAAVVFMITSMSLAYMSSNTTSVVDDVVQENAENSGSALVPQKTEEASPEAVEEANEAPAETQQPAEATEEETEEQKAE